MQKYITTLFFFVFMNTILTAQQSIQLDLGTSRGTQKANFDWSLSWYRNDALNSGHVLRVNYDKSIGDNEQEVRSKSLQIDVVKRWHSPLERQTTAYLEGGITGMLINSENQYNRTFDEDPCVFCLTIGDGFLPRELIFTKENSLLLYERKGRPYAFNIMPGFGVGGGFNHRFGKTFYMGMYYRANAYYWLGDNEVLLYLRYGLNVGWQF